jgi:hypothetical protein
MAASKCRSLGFAQFQELEPAENFADQTHDGIFIVEVKTKTWARSVA